MKPYYFFTLSLILILSSCSKDEGPGGRSSISGIVHLIDNTGGNQGEYDVPDYDVFIIYGNGDNIFDDDTKTNFDGTFKFNNLREGSYQVFAYSSDKNVNAGVVPIFKSIDIGGNEDASVGIIEVVK